LGWYTKEVVISYVKCGKCGLKGYYIEENRGQGVIKDRQKWCGCRRKIRQEKAAQPREAKAQQGSAWSGELESTAKKKVKERNIRRTFKILKEVWLNIRIEKVDMHEGVTVKVLLNSSTTRMFIDKEMA